MLRLPLSLIPGQLSGSGQSQLWMAGLKVLNAIPEGTLKTWLTLILPSTHKVLGSVRHVSEAKLDRARADFLEYLWSPQGMYINSCLL